MKTLSLSPRAAPMTKTLLPTILAATWLATAEAAHVPEACVCHLEQRRLA